MKMIKGFDNLDLPYGTGTFGVSHADQPRTTRGSGSDGSICAIDLKLGGEQIDGSGAFAL